METRERRQPMRYALPVADVHVVRGYRDFEDPFVADAMRQHEQALRAEFGRWAPNRDRLTLLMPPHVNVAMLLERMPPPIPRIR